MRFRTFPPFGQFEPDKQRCLIFKRRGDTTLTFIQRGNSEYKGKKLVRLQGFPTIQAFAEIHWPPPQRTPTVNRFILFWDGYVK